MMDGKETKGLEVLTAMIAAKAFVSASDVHAETDLFDDLSIDSLNLIELLVEVERHFGVRLDATRHHRERINTPEKIMALICEAGAVGVADPR